MFFYESTWSDSAVRRFIVRVGSENISNLFELRKADIFGMHNSFLSFYGSPSEKLLEEFKTRIHSELKKENAFSIKDLKINGNSLQKIGIPKGKMIGYILQELFKTVLDDPTQNTEIKLLEIAMKKISGGKVCF